MGGDINVSILSGLSTLVNAAAKLNLVCISS